MNTLQMPDSLTNDTIDQAHWFAIQTRPRHEKKLATELAQKGISTFLPLVTETRQWSDRRMQIDFPLFSCYLFVNIAPTPEGRVAVLQSNGVLSFVGRGKEPIPIPESQIEDVRRIVASKVPFTAHPFLEIGQRVRIRGGALDGIEGILERRKGRDQLILSVQTIQRSLSISVEGYDVEAVGPAVVYHA
jgi:transcription antitermination factor NusG